jgi:hypothetical protein
MAKSTDTVAWEQLDEMQRAYLQATYESDQEAERTHHRDYSRTKAAEWRWLPFSREASGLHYYIDNDLAIRLRNLDHALPLARQIFTSLAERGLIEMKNQTDKHCATPYLAIQITKRCTH